MYTCCRCPPGIKGDRCGITPHPLTTTATPAVEKTPQVLTRQEADDVGELNIELV